MPSCTKVLFPLSLKPDPDLSATSAVFEGECLGPSSTASERITLPSTILGRMACFCSSSPPRATADAPTSADANSGDAVSCRPTSSSTTPKVRYPRSEPPYCSGTTMPVQPISIIACQVSGMYLLSIPLSRISRNFRTGDCSVTQDFAWSRIIDCSSVNAAILVIPSECSREDRVCSWK